MFVEVLLGVANTKELAHSSGLFPGHRKGRSSFRWIAQFPKCGTCQTYMVPRHEVKNTIGDICSLDIGMATFAIFSITGWVPARVTWACRHVHTHAHDSRILHHVYMYNRVAFGYATFQDYESACAFRWFGWQVTGFKLGAPKRPRGTVTIRALCLRSRTCKHDENQIAWNTIQRSWERERYICIHMCIYIYIFINIYIYIYI